MRRALFAAVLLLGSATTHAGLITHEVNVNTYVAVFGSISYEHNLLEKGFVPGTATGGSIAIEVFEDGCSAFLCLDEVLPAWMLVVIDDFDFDTGGTSIGSFVNGLQIKALATINSTGILNVSIQSLGGDFKVGRSTLTVNTVSVPEPATLSLLGAGLLAIGLGRVRARKKKA